MLPKALFGPSERSKTLFIMYRYGTPCCGSEMIIPDPGSEFFHPGSGVKKILDAGSGSASKNLSIFIPTNCF
jgi:hypothetical protein